MASATSEYRPLLNENNRPGSNGLLRHSPGTAASGNGGISPTLTQRRVPKRWPWFIWFLLKLIGLYNYRRIVTRRRCHLCRLAVLERRCRTRGEETSWCVFYLAAEEEGGRDSDGEDAEPDGSPNGVGANMNAETCGDSSRTAGDGNCMVCRSEWWDARGRYRPYSETDVGVRRWNHPGSTVLSLIWPSALIGLIVYDFIVYLHDFWGNVRKLIHLISYSTFLLCNLSSPLLSLVANVRNMVLDRRGAGWRRGFSWYEALGVRYIVKRLQYLELGERGLPYKAYLVLCLLWPCLNGAYRVVICYVLLPSTNDVHMGISVAAGLVNMLVWGSFCYLILLMRLSFQSQLRLELAFLWRHAGALDVCRRRLAVFAEELGSICRLVSIWIVFVLAVSTWAFTTQICWDYLIISNRTNFGNTAVTHSISGMIWSENMMFLFLPLVAVGGMDLNGVWARFQRGVSETKSEATEAFWDKIQAFCREQSPVIKVKTVTLTFSVLGLFLGLRFGDQNVHYWPTETDNATTIDPALAKLIPSM